MRAASPAASTTAVGVGVGFGFGAAGATVASSFLAASFFRSSAFSLALPLGRRRRRR